jgi:hypothetical protein
VVLGGFGGVRQFSFMGVDLGHCVGGYWGVRQFSFNGVDLGQCVSGFRWFLGSSAIFLYGMLIWGTV